MGSQAPPSEPGRHVSTISSSAAPSHLHDARREHADTLQDQDHSPFSNTNIEDIQVPREWIDRKSVTFEDGEMVGGSRKCNNRRTDENSADEAAPIIRSNSATKDYQSISPNIPARGSSAAEDRTAEEGTTGNLQRGIQQERAEREAAEITRKESGRLRAFLEKYGSVELENKGSVARDHLALERTFLAWLRTSLSFASIGIAVTQLFRLNTSISSPSNPSDSAQPSGNSPQTHLRHVGKPLGATFIGISIVILFIGFHRYFEAQHYVIRGKFPASRGSIIVVSLVAGALILSSLVVILAVAPGAFEN